LKNEWGGFLSRDFILGIVITTLSFLSVVLIPLIGAMVIVLTPLPILFYYTKLGRLKGSAVYGISLALVLLILRLIDPDDIFPLLFFVFIGGTGIVLAEALRRSLPIEKTLMLPLMVLLTCGGCLLLLHGYQTGQAPWQLIGSYVSNSIRENIKIYEQLDISSEQITLIKEYAEQIAHLLTRIFPAVILVSTSLCLWINILAARSLFKKHGLDYPDFGDLTRWKAPEKTVWLLIATGGLLLIPLTAVKYTGLNLLIVCLFIYLCEGMSIIGYFFKVKRVPAFFKILFYVLILIQQYLLLFVIALGLFDLWADFRKFIRPAQDPSV
jgi:uncharacterized protein YybS (DUF2232 family)